ncbi:glycosyltransferase, partial [Paenibacillus koleovorans]|uniref:glycosyltransferase n=1 Tax=Paenibacillus koleovorans TaxID=121608 RepID=UPI001FEB011A
MMTTGMDEDREGARMTTRMRMEDKLVVSIIIPAWNEEARLGATIAALRRMAAEWPAERRCELVVVDDGSRDGTLAAARAAGAD